MTLIPIIAFALVLLIGITLDSYRRIHKRYLCDHEHWDIEGMRCRTCGTTTYELLLRLIRRKGRIEWRIE